MPLVRIDLLKGKPEAYRRMIGDVVYKALLGIGAPVDDRFQIVTEHGTEGILFEPDYLGFHRSESLVIIQITLVEGRSIGQKRQLFMQIADELHAATGLRREDVFVSLVEVAKENWSFGNGIAQYAT